MIRFSRLLILPMALVLMSVAPRSSAQSAAPAEDAREILSDAPEAAIPPVPGAGTWNISSERGPGPGVSLLEQFVGDQKSIWTSPLHLGRADAVWALPGLGSLGALLASDSWLSKQVPPGEIARSRSLSNYGAFSLAGVAGGMFVLGKMTHNDHASETGFLAGEAAVNAALADYALKFMFGRQRPYAGSGAGYFFAGGSSFPSEHAAVAWAVAGVVAHEYPGLLTRLISYGLASAVTVGRVAGKEHFPADAVVGSALGYFVAQQIYARRRDPEVSTGAWGSLRERSLTEKSPTEKSVTERNLAGESASGDKDKVRSPRHMGSPYVPLDSWVYPSIERLAALGYVETAYLGLRPWSRMECARLLDEAQEAMRYGGEDAASASASEAASKTASETVSEKEAQKILAALAGEFSAETARRNGASNLSVSLDSIYTRFTGIRGTPLRDGYHFGQTLVNDYGRPYGAGFNQVSGVGASGVAGPFSFSFRGEYQHSPSVASDPPAVLGAIAAEDGVVEALPDGSPLINRFRLIEGSIGVTLNNVKISFGRQNLWLGPGESGALLMTNNAAPITMLEIDNASPVEIPLLSHWLGPARMNSFLGQLSGQDWVYNPPPSAGLDPNVVPEYLVGPGFHPQPFLHGNKISFHPTPNLEFGMGVTAIFGGPGLPFTWHEFFRSYYSHNVNIAANPAKRFSSFDFTYRVPGLRNWLTFYTDSAVGDEISPIGSTRPMLNPGIYLPQLPKLPRLELRMEGFKADPRLGTMYIDRRYHSGYTNDGNLMGSWIGRQALGAEAWAKYSFSPRSTVQLGYRHQEVDRFLAGGGRLSDFSATGECRLSAEVAISARAQYESWSFPAIGPGPQSDFSTSFELTIHPGLGWRKN